MKLTGYMIPLIPFLWLISTNPIYLALIGIYGGFVWSGFNVSTFSFIFDNVSPQKRVRCVSYSNALNGLSIFLGATLGGYLLGIKSIFWTNFIILLIVSGIGRFLASLIMLPQIKEVKWVDNVTEPKLLLNVFTSALEGLKYPVVFFSDKKFVIKRKSEDVFEWIRKFIEKALGKRNKYG